MLPSRSHRLIWLSLLLSSAVTLVAFDDSAVLKSTGVVVLNGSGAPATTAIFSGDTVQTTGGAVLTISSPGSTVLLPQNSQLTFRGKSVSLTGGKATISTTNGMSVATDRYVIAPGNQGTAQYEIEKTGDTLLVHASRGAVTIHSSGKTLTLAEGQVGQLSGQTGLLSVQPSNPSSVAHSSTPTLDSLQDSLKTGDDSVIPICPSVSMCKVPPSISGYKPCRCRKL